MVTTGIQGLDAQLGGFPAGSTVLVLSEPSTGPDTFAEQFVAGGLIANEAVYYYNLERPKQDVVENLRKLLPGPDAVKNLQYFDCYSVKLKDLNQAALKKLGIENHAVKVPEDVVARLLRQPKEQPFRLVIESLTESIEAYGLEPTLQMLHSLTGMVKMMNGVALVLLVRGMHDHAVEVKIRHLVDGIVEFGLERQGFGLYTYISITKMRGVNDATRLMLYKETDKGLWLESTRRVF